MVSTTYRFRTALTIIFLHANITGCTRVGQSTGACVKAESDMNNLVMKDSFVLYL